MYAGSDVKTDACMNLENMAKSASEREADGRVEMLICNMELLDDGCCRWWGEDQLCIVRDDKVEQSQ